MPDSDRVQVTETRSEGLEAIATERARQLREGYDAEHDQQHAMFDFAYLIGKRLERVGIDIAPADATKLMRQIGALAAAAIDAIPLHEAYLQRQEEMERQRQAGVYAQQVSASEQRRQEMQRLADEARARNTASG